jgi:stearoyl-CoA desaturase (delta-9 desaturase)
VQAVSASEQKTIAQDLRRQVYWENVLALSFVHVGALMAVLYCAFVMFSVWTLLLGLIYLLVCMLSTTAGYHRLFSHRTYKGATPVRLFYLLFGAASGQGPLLRWASDHRMHHAQTDEENDPHSIRKGFWWAHIGWMLFRGASYPERRNVRDLLADPYIRFQDSHYLALLLIMGFLIPTLIGWTWGDAMGGLLVAGFARLVVQWHATFSINSVAHTFGRRPYAPEVSARDSALAAVLTLGEGYHNYHHRFPGDYRNGVRPFALDPTKWWVWLLSKLSLAWDLKRASAHDIHQARKAALRK